MPAPRMKLILKPDAGDARRVRQLVRKYSAAPSVRERFELNLNSHKPSTTKQRFWRIMVSCLVTTQQRSGPGSRVDIFANAQPFPLRYSVCLTRRNVEAFSYKTLRRFGLRRTHSIAKEVAANLALLEGGLWREVLRRLESLRRSKASPKLEREVADFIDDNLRGFGPKQSRNLLQWLGLTQFETPLDSRITKWLNQSGFPMPLSASLLSERRYYHFVSDSVRRLCQSAGVKPCVFDAAVFTSFDDLKNGKA